MSRFGSLRSSSGLTVQGTQVRRRRAPRLRAALFTMGAAAAAMVLVAPPAADVPTATTVAVQGTAATTCPVTVTVKVTPTPPVARSSSGTATP